MCSADVSLSGLKNSLRTGLKQPAHDASSAAVRLVQRVFAELVVRAAPGATTRVRRNCSTRSDRTPLGVEELLELDLRQLLDLGLGVVGAALLADAGADLPHDLLDVHRVGSDVDIGHGDTAFWPAATRAGSPCGRVIGFTTGQP